MATAYHRDRDTLRAMGGVDHLTCNRCGARALDQPRTPDAADFAFVCKPCRAALVDAPPAVPGFRELKLIKAGGMGAVYRAIDDEGGREVALKIILPTTAMDRDVRARFVREASIQRKLRHPRIVQVYKVLQEVRPAIFCMAMELIDGCDAGRLIADGPLPWRKAAALVVQALEGLGYAHDEGIVHRDIKAANILIGRGADGNEGVRLTDFGLAKNFQAASLSLTKGDEVGGTLDYLSPEQIRDFRNARPPSDVYSMGALLYHLTTREFPHDGKGPLQLISAIMTGAIVPIRERNPEIPEELAIVVEHALEKDAAKRFQSAGELRGAILAAVG
jgi:serine/threonine protein kinase